MPPSAAAPALFTTMSTRPKLSSTAVAIASTCSGSDTSAGTASASPPVCPISCATASSRSARLATRATRAPAPARAFANVTPRPDDAPVTTAQRPATSHICCKLRCGWLISPPLGRDRLTSASPTERGRIGRKELDMTTTALAVLQMALLAGSHETAPKGDKIEDLAWMAGSWLGDDEGTAAEEHWIPPGGGAMLGMHRDVREGRMVFFEFLRIEAQEGRRTYLARPPGRRAAALARPVGE